MLPLKYQERLLPEAGCDEAGRGCLAGPVVAAAVILPDNFEHPLLNDSKQLTEKQRLILKAYIEKHATSYAVAFVSPKKIDEINILQASLLAMHQALDQLEIRPKHIIVDGNKFNSYQKIQHTCVIKGDSKYASIAAASVLAKTARDAYMEQAAKKHPEYAWTSNKGYPTKAHRAAIRLNGTTSLHRMTFRLLPEEG